MNPQPDVEIDAYKDGHPYSVVIVIINLLIATVLAVLAINDYRQYLYIERLLNNPSVRLPPLAMVRAFALPTLTIALWLVGAVLELKRSRFATVYNVLLPIIVATAILFQFFFQFTSQTFLETQAVIALFDIPLLLISLLYLVIYIRRNKRSVIPGLPRSAEQ